MFTTKKIAVVSVINDLVTDNRVNRNCRALVESGYDVLLVGRKLPASLPLPKWPFSAKRMKLLFISGPAFYLSFNWRLFWLLLFKKTDLLFANDLDTLLPNYLVSKIKRIPLIYDSHELFCEVPELQSSPLKQKLWLMLERFIVPRLKHCMTVNDSIAKIFETKYGSPFTVVRNISDADKDFKPKSRADLGIDPHKAMLIMQGAGINIDRGAEELIDAMVFVEEAVLYIIGGGDVWPVLERKVMEKNLQDRVRLIGKLPRQQLLNYTHNADVGLSIDKDTNLNYHFSLPNKLFDYIQAGTPVLASRLPELERIITGYNIGGFIENHQAKSIADAVRAMLDKEKQKEWRKNMLKANAELNWVNEKQKLMTLISRTGS